MTSVVEPFLKALNKSKKRADCEPVDMDDVTRVLLDGKEIDIRTRTTDLLSRKEHTVEMFVEDLDGLLTPDEDEDDEAVGAKEAAKEEDDEDDDAGLGDLALEDNAA